MSSSFIKTSDVIYYTVKSNSLNYELFVLIVQIRDPDAVLNWCLNQYGDQSNGRWKVLSRSIGNTLFDLVFYDESAWLLCDLTWG
jgi:hypothetical protein